MEVKLNTIGIEFTFDAKFSNHTERHKFYRELYGWKSSSNYGKYLYIKDGILSNMKHIRPTHSAIIVTIKDAKEIRSFFRKVKVNFDEKLVILNEKESRELGIGHPNDWKKIYEELKGNENLLFSVDF